MWGLRWVLLGLGALLIVGIYLWGRGLLRRPRSRHDEERARVEPIGFDEPIVESIDEALPAADEPPPHAAAPSDEPGEPDEPTPDEPPVPPEIESVVTVRLVPKGEEWNAQVVVLALRAAGLRHGRYGIFHRLPDSGGEEPMFSVANLTEPGTFDLANLAETTLPGMSFFVLLPGVGDPVERFDMMLDTARSLALELDGELHDDRGSSWSIQRERYIREQIIQYRYQLARS